MLSQVTCPRGDTQRCKPLKPTSPRRDFGPLAARLSLTHDSKRQHPTSGAQLSAGPVRLSFSASNKSRAQYASRRQTASATWPLPFFSSTQTSPSIHTNCALMRASPNHVPVPMPNQAPLGACIQKSFDAALDFLWPSLLLQLNTPALLLSLHIL